MNVNGDNRCSRALFFLRSVAYHFPKHIFIQAFDVTLKNLYVFPYLQKCLKDHTGVMHKSSTDYPVLVLKLLPAELYLEATKEMILGIKLLLSSSTQEKSLLEGRCACRRQSEGKHVILLQC